MLEILQPVRLRGRTDFAKVNDELIKVKREICSVPMLFAAPFIADVSCAVSPVT